jgi:hypothetical protein
MKNASYVLWILLGLSPLSFAAAGPDFSGTWALDHENVVFNGVALSGQSSNVHSTMMISYDGNRLLAKNSRKREYIIDGTERNMSNSVSSVYTAKWEGATLVIDEKINVSTPFGPVNRISHQVWSLSDDGKILTISTSSHDSKGEQKVTTTQVYNKADAPSN